MAEVEAEAEAEAGAEAETEAEAEAAGKVRLVNTQHNVSLFNGFMHDATTHDHTTCGHKTATPQHGITTYLCLLLSKEYTKPRHILQESSFGE